MKSFKYVATLSIFTIFTAFAHGSPVDWGGALDLDDEPIGGGASRTSCQDQLVSSTIVDILAEMGMGHPAGISSLAPDLPFHGGDPTPIAAPEVAAPSKTIEEHKAEIQALIESQNEITKLVVSQEPESVNPAKMKSTLGKVNEFFGTLNKIFFERKSLVEVIRRAFVSEGSVLILGPGGTAKSDIADRIGENIVDENGKKSYYTLQLTQDTTSAETQGGLIVEDALAGRTRRNWEEGVLGSFIVFLDEFFDGRMKFIRSFLKAFNERVYTQGRESQPGLTKVFLAASNKYLNQIYEMFGNNDPQALIDRFNFVYYAPGVLQDTASILGLAEGNRPNMPKLTFQELDKLYEFSKTIPMSRLEVLRTQFIFSSMRRKLQAHEVSALNDYLKARQRGERVQPPYKTTRVFSPRSLRTAFKLIKVEALLRYSEHPEETLAVKAEDVDKLLSAYLIMQGPAAEKMDATMDSAEMDPYEKSQLQTMQIEQNALKETLDELHEVVDDHVSQAHILMKNIAEAADEDTKKVALFAYQQMLSRMLMVLEELNQAEKIGADQIAALSALKVLLDPAVLKDLK